MMIRHGDVQLIPVDKIPEDAKKIDGKEVAFGEVTGHAHRINVGDLFETKDGKIYLKTSGLTKIDHEEHKKTELAEKYYFCGIKRQYTPDGWEKVVD